MQTSRSSRRTLVKLMAVAVAAAGLLLSASPASATFYDGARISADSACSWSGQGTVQATLRMMSFGQPLISSLNGGDQLVAVQLNALRSDGKTFYSDWFWATATTSGNFKTQWAGYAPYTVQNARTGEIFDKFTSATGWNIDGADLRFSWRLQLSVAWYSGSTVVRVSKPILTVGGQYRSC